MENNNATLYIVSTPIGNLQEMTPRAIETLKNVAFIASEDTRNTRKLCQHFGIETPLVSCHEHNEAFESEKIIEAIHDGRSVAITSDAGYPGISDPGSLVISKCLDLDIKVEVISGPCALINALVGSGLPTNHFYFHGFLSHHDGDRKKELEELCKKEETMIFYEAPHRIVDTLEAMNKIFGLRKACIARELTKKFEEYLRGTLEELLNIAITRPLKGEMVLVVEGCKKEEKPSISHFEIVAEVNKLVDEGMSTRDAIRSVADAYKINKNDVYRIFHQ